VGVEIARVGVVDGSDAGDVAIEAVVLPITRGRRFAFLRFVFDAAAARIRDTSQPAQVREGPSQRG